MTDSAQTLEQLQAEIAALKEERAQEAQAKEVRKLQQELAELKADEGPKYAPGCAQDNVKNVSTESGTPTDLKDVKLASVRQGLCGFAHFMGGPIASVYYGSKTGYWMPTLAATGVAVVGIPFMLLDLGFTTFIGAPATSAILLITQSQEKRRKLGIQMPEQADAMMAKFSNF